MPAPSNPASTWDLIYAVVARIPAGRVATYGQVAALAGLGRAARQVGYALHALPEGSDVPWQRVINSRGEVSPRALPGWDGYQRHLLEEEGVGFDAAGRVDLDRFRWDPDAKPARRRKPASAIPGWIDEIEAGLRALGTPERAEGAKAYLKSELDFLGVTTPDLRREVRAWLRAHRDAGRRELLALVEALWNTRLHELKGFAIELLTLQPDRLESADLDLLERMLRTSGTWAYVDSIAAQLVGPLVERTPALNRRLDRWARDKDFWIRRSALLALLLPLRRGGGDWDRFVRYADTMLAEKEFFIRKAIGWVLREVSKKRPGLVAEYLAARPGRLSGVTLREAVKYLPGEVEV